MAYTDSFPVVPNFYETSLTAPASPTDTTLYLMDVSSLPSIIVGRDFIPIVLSNGSQKEIAYVKSVNTQDNSVTVSRGEEQTDPADWPDLTYVYSTVTAEALQKMRVNGFCPVVDSDGNRPTVTKASATSFTIPGDWTSQLEAGTAVRLISTDGEVSPSDASIGAIHLTTLFYANGVTTIGVRNAQVPDNISGLDVGMQKSSAPLYTPDQVYADGVTLKQNGNIISAPVATANTRGIVKTSDIVSLVKGIILDAAYPVGAVYISTVSTSPASLFGGTWTSLGGRFLIGANSSYAAGSTGGEATHKLTESELIAHTHSVTCSTVGNHTHDKGTLRITGTAYANAEAFQTGGTGALQSVAANGTRNKDSASGNVTQIQLDTNLHTGNGFTGSTGASGSHTHTVTIGSKGGSAAHNNMPPYLSVYMWKRTA